MKTLLAMIVLCLSTSAIATQYVSGYYKSDGTYVEGYQRTSPNGLKEDNYSYGNNSNYNKSYNNNNYNYNYNNNYNYRPQQKSGIIRNVNRGY